MPDLSLCCLPLSVNDGSQPKSPILITYQQLNIFDKANRHHHRRPGDTGEKHDFEEAHEKDSNQHSHRLYLFSSLLL